MSELQEYANEQLATLLPFPPANAHKYSRGKLAVVGGSARYPGAAVLAACAAQRMGAGYVEVRCAPEAVSVVQAARPSVVARSWEGDGVVAGARAVVLGVGFDDTCGALAEAIAVEADVPLVADGGALSLLATETGVALVRARSAETLLTPHGGEAARLARAAGVSVPAAEASDEERGAFAVALAHAYRAAVILKGSNTFISDGERIVVMCEGTAALAKAGTGDVLAGMAGALLAQGLGAFDAAVLAATLHARAGNAAAETLTSIGVCAEDVIAFIPVAIKATQ